MSGESQTAIRPMTASSRYKLSMAASESATERRFANSTPTISASSPSTNSTRPSGKPLLPGAVGGTLTIPQLQGAAMMARLESRAAFETYQRSAQETWQRTWSDRSLVVSVGVDSSSVAKGAERVLAACRAALQNTNAIVREVSGLGSMWLEPHVEIKRPGEPPILYGWIEPTDVPRLLAGELNDHAVGVRGETAFNGIPPLSEHPFFKHQMRIVMEDIGVIEPESIDDAIARGAY